MISCDILAASKQALNSFEYSENTKQDIVKLVAIKKDISYSSSLSYSNKKRLFNYIDTLIDTVRYKSLTLQ